jgi:hypothetical protein
VYENGDPHIFGILDGAEAEKTGPNRMMLGSAKYRLQRRTQIGNAGLRRQIIDIKATRFAEADNAPVFTAQDSTGFRAATVNAKNKVVHELNDFA